MSVLELFGENRGLFLAVKNFTVLPHFPRKIIYLQNLLKMSLKKIRFPAIEEKIYLIVIKGYI